MAGAEKTCRVCGRDCSTRPRVKDRHGHYYCKECYEKAATQKPQPKAPAMPSPDSSTRLDNDDSLNLLDEFSAVEAKVETKAVPGTGCPKCGRPMAADAVLCTSCGYNRKTGKQISMAATAAPAGAATPSKGSGFSFDFKQPWVLGAGLLVVFLALFAVAKSNEELAMVYVGANYLFSLVVGITILVNAFSESVGQGILCLCLPFYSLYFVFLRNDNIYLKFALGVNIITTVLSVLVDNTLLT